MNLYRNNLTIGDIPQLDVVVPSFIPKFKLEVNSAKVLGTHTDFPVYIDLSEMPTAFWDTVLNGGGDIRCYSDEALTTELPREVVSCDTATDTGELHVKTGLTTTTSIYIKVDGTSTEPTASSTYGKNNVWNSNYKAVYHLEDATDSTANANNGTVSGATSGATGQIGDGYSFDGSNDYIILPSILGTVTEITISSWIKANNTSAEYRSLAHNADNPYVSYRLNQGGTANRLQVNIYIGTTEYTLVDTSTTLTNLNKITITAANNGTAYLYVNGVLKDSTSVSGTFNRTDLSNVNNTLGSSRGYGNYLHGIIDETTFLSVLRTSDWETTEYNNQNDPSTFWTITKL